MEDSKDQFVEVPVAPPEWDAGTYTVFDNGTLVALLWVVTGVNKYDATEYWGLSNNWVWPDSTHTDKTFRFKYTTAYGAMSTTAFKSACTTEFGAGNTTYQKHTTQTF
ncbi:MAG: hypothetical protein JWM10_3392 [Myxococcaceae bacterium]|nr:hypothetical protein [Myxococcaceae bacterium]